MKKTIRIPAVLMIILMITAMTFAPAFAEDEDFDAFLEQEWVDTMEEDYLTLHSSVTDYNKMGLKKPEVTLGKIDYDEFEETVSIAEEALENLLEFDVSELSEERQYDYRCYEFYLESLIDMYSYPDLYFMFRPYTGYLNNVTDYFADFGFYSKEDVEDYFTLIEELPSYIEQMKTLTEQQADKGYFLDDVSFSDEMSELNDFIEKGEKNPMILNFNSNIDKFKGATDEEKASYKKRNKILILDSIIPSYRDVRSFLSKLKGSSSAPTGALYEYRDGDGYYNALLKYYTSTWSYAEEIFKYLTKALKEINQYSEDLLATAPEDFKGVDEIKGLTELEDFIEYLRDHMEGFPEGPDVEYSISYLPKGSNDFAMAYYIPAPVDNIKQNIMRVNKEQTGDVNTLYYTLAHEGFPGHLYQFTWFQAQEGYVPLRHEISFMGYEEGWANYVEKIMLDRSGLDHLSAEVIALDELLAYCLYSGADVAVNGLGYDIDQLTEWIEDIGLSANYAEELYDISVEMPGTYLPYGFGAAKFWEFRERVQSALEDDFDEEEFHKVILTHGPRPFGIVEEDLKAYVRSKGARLPEKFIFLNHERTEEMGPAEPAAISLPIVKIAVALAAILIFFLVIVIIVKKRNSVPLE